MRTLKINDIGISGSKNDIMKYLKSEYYKLLSLENEDTKLLYQPYKSFEIFNLDVYGGKTFLADVSNLPDGEDRELFYDFNIANKIYKKIIDIKDSAFNEYEEVQYIYENDILKNESEIIDLKLIDNKKYENDMQAYNIISQTDLYKKFQLLNEDKNYLLTENEKLNNVILEYDQKVKSLSKKLKYSLDRVEVLQKPKSFCEKLKYLFIKYK